MERIQRQLAPEIMEQQNDYKTAVRDLKPLQKRFFIQTFGCQLNDHDSETIAAQLLEMGFEQAAEADDCDLFLLNTCSIRENADQRFFGHLGKAKELRRKNPTLLVAVCGCMMKIDEHVDRIKRSYPFVDMIFGPQDIYRFPEILYRRLSGSRRVYDIGDQDLIAEGLPVAHERKYRALCTIMYGCNNYCTYCVVPYTRGRERSRSAEEIIREIRELERNGFSEVMLLGQNVNSYGRESGRLSDEIRNNFAALLERICRETAIPRIRFMTSHPKDISLELLDVMARHPQIERHLHLPLQSGSDRILKKMNRHYDLERYMNIVGEAKKRIPEIAFSTDIIVGFPSETEEDFEATLKAVRAVRYDSAFTFMYSPRYGTPAAVLEEQIPQEIMQERFERLLAVQNENSLRANEERVGKCYELLIEGLSEHSGNRLTGRSSDFHLVNFDIPAPIMEYNGWEGLTYAELGRRLEGSFCEAKILEAKTFSLVGEMTQFRGKSAQFDRN